MAVPIKVTKPRTQPSRKQERGKGDEAPAARHCVDSTPKGAGEKEEDGVVQVQRGVLTRTPFVFQRGHFPFHTLNQKEWLRPSACCPFQIRAKSFLDKERRPVYERGHSEAFRQLRRTHGATSSEGSSHSERTERQRKAPRAPREWGSARASRPRKENISTSGGNRLSWGADRGSAFEGG